jgi:hypothetical protein
MAVAIDNLIRSPARRRRFLKQASDERLNFAVLTTAPDGDANVLPGVMSQADKLTPQHKATNKRSMTIPPPVFSHNQR